MKKYVIVFLTLIFFVWLLPLGFFIKPSQEKSACNGQRAICMCKAPVVAKVLPPAFEGASYKAANQQQEKSSSNANAGAFYLTFHLSIPPIDNERMRHMEHQRSTQQSFLRSLEHVPKA